MILHVSQFNVSTDSDGETDNVAMRELVRLSGPAISSVALIIDFGWILVVHAGSLLAYNLHTMIPTSDPSTWVMQGKLQAVKINSNEHHVSFVRLGYTKDRLMGDFTFVDPIIRL